MQLFNYFRSSASFRVRIALNLKGLPYGYEPIHLVRHGGEQRAPAFLERNPDGLVPMLVDDAQDPPFTLTQSLAIIEYLDEIHPEPALLPRDAIERARVRQLALNIACEIHPLNNLRVLQYLTQVLAIDDRAKNTWIRHWIESGLQALDTQLGASPATGRFCHGDQPTMADLTLVPQIFNGRRFGCDYAAMPTVMRIFDTCMTLDAFKCAEPSAQPDAE